MADFCSFCGRPFEDAEESLRDEVEEWETFPKERQLSFTPPPPPSLDIVEISGEDGRFWQEVVCVGPTWNSYVSSPGQVWCDCGHIAFNDNNDHLPTHDNTAYLIFHPGCLSFLCHRINASPEQIWGSVYSPGSNYLEYNDHHTGLLKDLEYYDVHQFHPQGWGRQFCLKRTTPRKDGKEGYDVWKDPESMKPLQWILARPIIFPVVPSLSTSVPFLTTRPVSQAPCMKIFNLSEIFNNIINCLIGQDLSQTQLEEELKADNVFTPPSIMQGTKDIFALLQVNKTFYKTLLRDRQDIFIRLIWLHGWMLPAAPEDWTYWLNGSFHNGTVFKAEADQDWWAYLLIFLRKDDVHVKSRWRFQKLAMQFGRGRLEVKDGREYRWRFPVGELAFRPDVKFGRNSKA